MKSSLLKCSDGARHVRGSRHEQPKLLRLGLDERGAEGRILVGVLGLRLENDTRGFDAAAEFGERPLDIRVLAEEHLELWVKTRQSPCFREAPVVAA